MLNEAKTEATVFCVPYRKAPPTVNTINVCGFDITPLSFVANTLCMSTQVARTFQWAYFQLHNNPCVQDDCTCIVTSRLDYGNVLLFGVEVHLIEKLQIIKNLAAGLIMQQ